MKRILKYFFSPILSAFVSASVVLMAVCCEKPVIDVEGDKVVESVSMPESLNLRVGQSGSFEVVFRPADARDARIVSLTSSDESVLKVSYVDFTVSYEALSVGESSVSVKVGSVTKSVLVVVTENGSVDPVVSKGGYRVEFIPGLRSVTSLIEAAAVKVDIVEGSKDGNYMFTYAIDGGEPAMVRGLFLGDSKTVVLDGALGLGKHSYRVTVSEEASLTESADFEGFFWVKGPSISSAWVTFTSEFDADFVLSTEDAVSLSDGETGWAWFRHLPATTYVMRDYDIPEFLQLDFEKGVSEEGLYKVPFQVLSAGEGRMKVRFVNGDEETLVEGNVNGKSTRPLGVKDYSVPQDLKIALGGGSQTYTFVTVPEHAYNPEITEMKSSDEDVLSVSWRDLTATFTPNYTGTVTVSMVLSGIAKEFTVEVAGNVVTDFAVPEGLEIVMGESAGYDLVVSPQGALDAKVEELSSSDESVLTVSSDGLHLLMQGVKRGEATVSVTVGHVKKSFVVKVLSDEVSDFKVPENLQLALGGGAQSYTFEPVPVHPSDGSIVSIISSDESILKVSGAGLTATFTPMYTGEVTVTVTIGKITKAFGVKVTGDVVTDFTVPANLEVVVGKVADYDFEVTPLGALDAKIESVQSSDENIMKMSYNGLRVSLTGVAEGTAKATVVIGKVSKTFSVKVLGLYVEDYDVPSDYTLELGSSKSYTFVPKPEGSSDASLTKAKSSDEDILKVEIGGGCTLNLIPVYPGTATVTVTIGSVTKSFDVKVEGVVVTDFAVPADFSIERGKTAEFYLTPTPSEATDATLVSLTCSDESVVEVSNEGLKVFFSAKKLGNAKVTCVLGRKTKSFDVVVTAKRVTDFSVPADLEFEMLTSREHILTYIPEDADDAVINELTSSDEGVVKVSKDGLKIKLEGVMKGEATVTVKVGTVVKSFGVKINGRYVSDYSVPVNMTMNIGEKTTYDFVPTQSGCLDAEIVSISSSDESVLKVSGDGLTASFEALYVGSSTVTVKVGSVTKSFVVTVNGSVVTGISVASEIDGAVLKKGDSVQAYVVPTPSGAYDAPTMKLSSGNTSVVTVTDLGNFLYSFKAVGYGSSTITATAGRVTKTFVVNVNESLSVDSSLSVDWFEEKSILVSGEFDGWTWQGSGSMFDEAGNIAKNAYPFNYGEEGNVCKIRRDGNRLYIKNNVRSSVSDVTGRIVFTSSVTGATATCNVTLKKGDGKCHAIGWCTTDEDGYAVFNLKVRNAKSDNLELSYAAFYYMSDDAIEFIDRDDSADDFYYNALFGNSPGGDTLYYNHELVGRYKMTYPASGQKNVAGFSECTWSWRLDYKEDRDAYVNGVQVIGHIVGRNIDSRTDETKFASWPYDF